MAHSKQLLQRNTSEQINSIKLNYEGATTPRIQLIPSVLKTQLIPYHSFKTKKRYSMSFS